VSASLADPSTFSFNGPIGNDVNLSQNVASPAVLASGKPYQNVAGPALVFLSKITDTTGVSINGAPSVAPVANVPYYVATSASITLTYGTTKPPWTWMPAGPQ